MFTATETIKLPEWWSRDLDDVRKSFLRQLSILGSEVSRKSIEKAIGYAKCKHQDQRRAGGEDYIIHPIRVCLSLLEEFEISDETLLVAALLHDVIEDSEMASGEVFGQIERRFGRSVANLVQSVTREPEEKRSERGDRYGEPYYRRIESSGDQAIVLKVVDKLDNIRDSLNHPVARKRHVYLKECQRLFMPLLDSLPDVKIRDRIAAMLKAAMMNHQFYVDRLRLFNPTLDHWLTRDDVQIVATTLDTLALARNVVTAIFRKIDKGDFNTLVDIADLPYILAEPDKTQYWHRVRRQCQILVHLLSSEHPDWVKPALEDRTCLFSLIHSRLLMPANWLFPIWTEDYAVSVLDGNCQDYRRMFKNTGDLWVACMRVLLTSREAIWRQHLQVGNRCAHAVLADIRRGVPHIEYRTLLSTRLISEYLDVTTSTTYCNDNIKDQFDCIWRNLECEPSAISDGPSEPARQCDSPNNGFDVEIQGLHRIRCDFPENHEELDTVARLVRDLANETNKEAWVYFNHVEIEKRCAYFKSALKKVKRTSTVSDLRRNGISVRTDTLDWTTVLTVEPDKGDALKDRLPETSDEQRRALQQSRYTAVSIFDTLLKSQLLPNAPEPVWIPRVYRILDTIADFDPGNVQLISITLHGEEDFNSIPVALPIPVGPERNSRDEQQSRKEIVARYIAATIYNHVVTLGIYSATLDCMPVSEEQHKFAFTNDELEDMVAAAARTYNYEQQYAKYIETYNYRKFSIEQQPQVYLPVRFRTTDMRHGTFLGIDIGGTDTKVCLFRNGQLMSPDAPVLSFPTFEKTVGNADIPAKRFLERIIDRIESHLEQRQGEAFSWHAIDGIGFSWPGAVRDSRIVGLSRTLARLSFEVSGNRLTFSPNSSAAEIHSADLTGVFRRLLLERSPDIQPSFVATLENDGNAEAYGNYCSLRLQGSDLPGGTLVIKLGTSLAGGHIDIQGAISPHVAEFSKLILDFNSLGGGTHIQGPARNFVSSQGIRDLTRSFKFNDETVFGQLECRSCGYSLNYDDSSDFRIESVEVGELLALFELLDDADKSAFLDELVAHDNERAPNAGPPLQESIAIASTSSGAIHDQLIAYIASRGREEQSKLKTRRATPPTVGATPWQLGVNRTLCLLRLPHSREEWETNVIPASLDGEALARAVLGSVALFSQLSLHIAHLTAALYNIYTKRRFTQIVLAGGVLKGKSGSLVQRQTEAFLAKYYDKIFGPTKYLKLGSVRLAPTVDSPEAVGPFGAAMVASRRHKIQSLAVMEKKIEAAVRALEPGRSISMATIEALLGNSRVSHSDIERYLQILISRSIVVQRNGDTYVKVLNTE